METKSDDASPTQEVRWETVWRERSRNKSIQDQDIIDQNSLKGSLRSNSRSTMQSNKKTLFEVEFEQRFSESFSELSENSFQKQPRRFPRSRYLRKNGK